MTDSNAPGLHTRHLLARLEAYYDAAPRASAHAEEWPPFTLFVPQGASWPFYARPALGTPPNTPFTAADVHRVRERQRALRLPEAFEWVAEVTPLLRAAVATTGLPVHEHPLLVLDPSARPEMPAPEGADVRLVTPDDDLPLVHAVAAVGFGAPGTAIGEAGTAALAARAAQTTAARASFMRHRLRTGATVTAAAFVDGLPVAMGSHQPIWDLPSSAGSAGSAGGPRGGVTEVVGVATLPAFRRRGLAAAVVDCLVQHALTHGVTTVFLSAGDETVARVYARLGFRPTATACIAEDD